jgi:hypothetical protein
MDNNKELLEATVKGLQDKLSDFEPTFDYDNRVVIGNIEFNSCDYVREPIINKIEKTFNIIDDTEDES